MKRDASEKEIKQAFRRLARQHHPDVNPGNAAAEARFKEINAAYEVLSDADSRKKYDQYGDDWQQADQLEGMRRQQRQGPTGRRRGRRALVVVARVTRVLAAGGRFIARRQGGFAAGDLALRHAHSRAMSARDGNVD